MTFIWTPDSCDCKIEYKDNSLGQIATNFKRYVNRCNLHKTKTGQTLAAAVLAHNQGFNRKYGLVDLRGPANEAKRLDMRMDKRNEKLRIRGLP